MVKCVLMGAIETSDHHGSHRDLLWVSGSSLPWPARGQVDAIIVPTVRPLAYLAHAAQLAAQLACPLVTLHSGKWTSAREAARRVPSEVSLIAIDMPGPAGLQMMDFETTRLTAGSVFARRTDTSAKRNLGLMLSHMVGWKRIIFLDDDILVPDPADLSHAVGLLDIYNAVGLSIGGFPDNSVVCHAYRTVGGKQESFIGGGALAGRNGRHRSFFPEIYNEDWFYLLDPTGGLQPLAVTGRGIQGKYDPFRNEGRARREEFGDVLAEGIFWLLDQGGSLDQADLGHWRDFIGRRRRFIQHVLDLVNTATLDLGEQARMAAALRAALGRLALIEPDLCQKYLQSWLADRQGWEQHVRNLPSSIPPDAAVTALFRAEAGPVNRVVRVRQGSALAE